MNASMPIMQLLGAVTGSSGQSSPATVYSDGGEGQFSGIMGSLIGANGIGSAVSGADGSSSTINASSFGSTKTTSNQNSSTFAQSTSSETILSALQSGQISPETLDALNVQQANGTLDESVARLAQLLSSLGGGRVVPLSADLDLSQLEAAGIELPEGFANLSPDGKAMLLVSQDALKSLLAGGGWKSGESVPAMLMLGSGEDGQGEVGYLDVSLSVVAAASENDSAPSLSFQLNIDPEATINTLPTAEQATSQPVMELAGLIAGLMALAASDESEEGEQANSNAELAQGENALNMADLIVPVETDAVEAQTDVATIVEPVESDAGETQVEGAYSKELSGIGSGQEALPSVAELTAEINSLIAALTAGQASGSGQVTEDNTKQSATEVLRLLAGQAATDAGQGNNEAARNTLELIGKLGDLSSLSDAEKQQVLAELANGLRSLLQAQADSGEIKETGTARPAALATPVHAFAETSNETPLATATTSVVLTETETGHAAALPVTETAASELTTESATSQTIESGSEAAADKTTAGTNQTQHANDTPANGENMLAALESAAATASELAEKLSVTLPVGKTADTASAVRTESDSALTQNGTTQQAVSQVTAQTEAAIKTAAASLGTETATTVKPQVTAGQQVQGVAEDAPSVRLDSDSKDVKNTVSTIDADGNPSQASTDRTVSLAASAEAGSNSQQVSVPVSLSSLNKARQQQPKTQQTSAASAFSSNSQTLAKAGESNDFLQAVKAAAGEEGVEDLVEATLVNKKGSAKELLTSQLGNTEQSDKSGNSPLQAGLRLESAAGARQDAARVEQAVRQVPVQTTNASEAFEKIVSTARLTTAGTMSELTMKLEPDHLGMMRVKISVDENNVMNARVQVESSEARSLIENNLHRLRESLAEQGIKVEKFSVDVRQEHGQHQNQFAGSADNGEWNQTGRGAAGNAAGSEFSGSKIQGEVSEGKPSTVNKYSYSTLEWVA